MDPHEHLERWQTEGLIDGETVDRIRAFEAAQPDTCRVRWPVILALCFGGVLLAAGLFLFVEAHWSELSPAARIAITMFALAALHLAGAGSRKYPALATTFHAIGTAALGGAIAISGQVFNMDEHWPTAILLWALGAWVGFALLRDVPQLVMAAVLTPTWVVSEFVDYERFLPEPSRWTAAFIAVLALVYLSATRADEKSTWRHALAAIGAVALIPAAIITCFLDRAEFAGSWILLLPLPVAYALRGRANWPVLLWLLWAVAQVYTAANHMPVLGHIVAGAGSTALAAWGIAELRKERINLGLAAFVIIVLSFYFSYVADAINRSLGLIVLGIVFLAGGWQLERFRRTLMRRIEEQRA